VRPEDNPWTSIVMQAIAAEVDVPPPDPDRPSMFRCAAPGVVSRFFESGGLRDVSEQDVAVALVTQSPEQYWEMSSEHMSLAAAALNHVEAPARERIERAVLSAVRAYETEGLVRVPGMARCIVGTR
jgi:hypothetical protein